MNWLLAQEIIGEGIRPFIEAAILPLLFVALFAWIAGRMSQDTDRKWLQHYVVLAYLAKVFGAFARYWMVTGLYERGDSYQYHLAGETFANVWRGFVVPVSTSGGEGTAATQVITGFIYAIFTPSFLGGFLLFATLAFVGQLLFYGAFRRWFGAEKQRLYALAVLFFPSLIFWPSSIGKDALMVLFLGIAAYGASRLLATYKIITSSLMIGAGLILASRIRPHVAGMLALALVLAILLGKAPAAFRGSPKRPVMLIGAVAGTAFVLLTFSSTFQVGLDADRTQTDISGFLEDVSDQTGTGGSAIDGVAITTPSRLPLAVITVLFRPLIHEGTSIQVLASALEGTVMLGLVIWKFPQMWRNKGLLRRKSYMTLCFFYTGGFIIGFSAIQNLGILARQRVQLLPMFLALIVGLGWPEPEHPRGQPDQLPAREPRPEPPPRVPAYAAAIAAKEAERAEAAAAAAAAEEAAAAEALAAAESETEAPPPKKTRKRKGNLRDRIRPEVVELFTADPDISLREIARRVDASPSTVRRVLVEEGLK